MTRDPLTVRVARCHQWNMQHRSKSKSWAWLAVGALALSGCLTGDDPPSPELGPDSISRTIVVMRADGTQHVKNDVITADDVRAELKARAELAKTPGALAATNLAVMASSTEGAAGASAGSCSGGTGAGTNPWCAVEPSDCTSAALQLFDRTNLTGNEICFYGWGHVNLNEFRRVSHCWKTGCLFLDWSHAVRSYQAGVSSGTFNNDDNGGVENYAAMQRVDVASPLVQGADGFFQNAPPP
jgi:hypothetical protein